MKPVIRFKRGKASRASLHRFRRRRTGAIATIALALAALTITQAPIAPLEGVNAAQAARAIVVEISKGRIIRLRQSAKTVFVADPNIADVQVKSSKLIYLFGKKVGETTLIAVDANDKVLLNIGVSVNHNLSRMRRALRAVLPGKNIRVRSIDGAVVLTGTVPAQRDAVKAQQIAARFVEDEQKNVVNQISVSGPNQVNLRVRVIEINKDTLKRIGINWDSVIRVGSVTVAVATGTATAATLGNLLGSDFNLRNGATPFTNNNIGISSPSQLVDVNALIDLLDREGLVKILAEPNLSAMSGKKASFLAGGEFPVPIPQSDGVITVEYKKFGVGLSFTPVILSGGRIKMLVAPEVSTLSNTGAITLNNITVPALQTRRAETMVEVGSGQSIVIGGLLQNNVTKELRKLPGLGDIPILGKLFQSQSYQRQETELVIVATPYIVKPFNQTAARPKANKPAMPGAARTTPRNPNGVNIVRGQFPSKAPEPRANAQRKLVNPSGRPAGPAGFVLE